VVQEVGEAGNRKIPIYTQRPQLAADQTVWLLGRHIETSTTTPLDQRVEDDDRNILLTGVCLVTTSIEMIKVGQGRKDKLCEVLTVLLHRVCAQLPNHLFTRRFNCSGFMHQTLQRAAIGTAISHGIYVAPDAAMTPLLSTSRGAEVSLHCRP
jgi:hypothetical protein